MPRKPLYEDGLVSVHVQVEPKQKELLTKKAKEKKITVTDLIRQLIDTLDPDAEVE